MASPPSPPSSPSSAAPPSEGALPSEGTQSIWVVEEGLVSASEAAVLAERLPRSALARASQDLLRGLGRAQPRAGPSHPHWPGVMQALSHLLDATAEDLPWAAWAAQADGLQPQPGDHWGFLSTGRLHMTPQQVRLIPQESPRDAKWLAALESGLAEELAVTLHQGLSGQLYLSSAQPLELSALHPALLQDEHLPDVLPSGEQARAWRKASQMACMLTYAWSSEQGYPDALWLWGVCDLRPALIRSDPLPAGAAGAPLWLEGFRRAWSEQRHQPLPRLQWRPMPSEPAPGQDMVGCWAQHWQDCLDAMARDAAQAARGGARDGARDRARDGARDGAPILIASLKGAFRTWALRPVASPVWQLGLGQPLSLRDLPALLSVPETA